jgi:hypothetical protein
MNENVKQAIRAAKYRNSWGDINTRRFVTKNSIWPEFRLACQLQAAAKAEK